MIEMFNMFNMFNMFYPMGCYYVGSSYANSRCFSYKPFSGWEKKGEFLKSFNDFTIYTTSDGDRIINLPSIENEFKFKRDLTNILLLLNKEKEKYKLYYYLYLRTNDENKELLSLLASENWLESKIGLKDGNITEVDHSELQNYTMGLMMLDKFYEYKGFSVIHSTIFDRDTLLGKEGLNEYVTNVFNILGKSVVYINEERLDPDEFIEFKKSSLVGITKINNPNN